MKLERENSQRTPAQIRREIRIVKQLVNEGRINSDILERRQTEYQIFPATEPAQIPQAQKSIPSLEVPQAGKEKEEEKLSHIRYWREDSVIEIDGEKKFVTGSSKAVFDLLFDNANQDIEGIEITKVTRKAGNYSQVDVAINRLRKKIEKDPENPILIVSSVKNGLAVYKLAAEVELVEEPKAQIKKEPISEQEKKQKPIQLINKDQAIIVGREKIFLKGHQWRLMKFFYEHEGEKFTLEELAKEQDIGYDDPHQAKNVKVNIQRLREKLGEPRRDHRFILSKKRDKKRTSPYVFWFENKTAGEKRILTEKPEEKDWKNAILEKDGQTLQYSDIMGLRKSEEIVFKEIWGKDISISVLLSTLYPELSKEKATHRLTSAISRTNVKLAYLNWQIINLVPNSDRHRGKESVYTIAPIEREESKEKKNIPFIQVDEKNKTVFIDGVKHVFRSGVSWQTFLLLARNPNFPVLGKAVEKTAKKAGSKAKHAIAGDSIDSVRSKLKAKDKDIKLISIVRHGQTNRTYQLNAKVEFLKEQVSEKKDESPAQEEVKTESLSEDEVLKKFLEKATPNERSIAEFFIERSKHGLRETTYAGLTHYMYGEIPKKVRYNRLSVALVNLRKKLSNIGYEIVSERKGKNIYLTLRKKAEEQKELEAPKEEPKEVEIEPAIPVPEPASESEIQLIPYEAGEGEKRTKEETKVLDVIVSFMLSSFRLEFDRIQGALYSEDKTKPVRGIQKIPIYWADELKELFTLALQKIREEAEIDMLRKNWSDEDRYVWEKLNSLLSRSFSGDVDALRRRVSQEITRAERRFLRSYPPEQGHKMKYITRREND